MPTFRCFVAIKFGKAFDSIYEVILRLEEKTFGDNCVRFTRADESLESLQFLGNIWKNVAMADFVLADISSYGMKSGNKTVTVPYNPNVYYEIGYAKALEKPLIVISQDGQQRPPADLADCTIHPYSWDPAETTQLTRTLIAAINHAIEAVETQRAIIRSPYCVTCYSDRKSAAIDKSIAAARREILILQTNLETLRRYYLSPLKKAVEAARKSDHPLTVKILTLDPDSLFAAFRAQQLSKNVAAHRRNLYKYISEVMKETKNYPEIELRVYDDFPNQIFFMADDDLFLCPMARLYPSRELCTFKTNLKYPGSYKSFVEHFTDLWSHPFTYRGYII